MDTTLEIPVIYGVQPDQIDESWPYVLPLLEDALKSDSMQTIGIEQVYDSLKNQYMQLWVIVTPTSLKAAVVTQIDTYPKQKVLTVVLCGGHDVDDWLKMLVQLLRDFGTHHQCNSVVCHGRKGWARKLKRIGWVEVFTTVGMRL